MSVKIRLNDFSVCCFCCKLAACLCRRLKYSADDDKAILSGLLIDERYKKCGGDTVWKELEQLKV